MILYLLQENHYKDIWNKILWDLSIRVKLILPGEFVYFLDQSMRTKVQREM